MSTSPISSHVNLTSGYETSLLSPPSTAPSLSLGDDHAHSNPKGHYIQLPMKKKDQVFSHDSDRPAQSTLGPWLFELLSLSLAIIAIAILAVLLAMYDKKPNPAWATRVSINAIVSAVSVLFRASIMVPITKCISQLSWIWLAKGERPLGDIALFDQASRGAIGGLTMLASPRHVTSFVSTGAILMVVMLAVGPCFQQTVVYYSAQVTDSTSLAYTSAAFGYNGSTGYIGGSYAMLGTYLCQICE